MRLAGRRTTRLLPRCLVLLFFWGTFVGPVHAQPNDGDPPTVQPAVTAEAIEALRKQAADSTELDGETKTKIEAAATQALDGLKRIGELQRLTEQFKTEAANTQARADKLRKRLAELQDAKPSAPTDLTLPELELEVPQRESALAELKAAQLKSESDRTSRPNRRRELRTLLLSSMPRLAEIQKQLDTPAPADEPPLLTQARRAALLVRKRQIEAEEPALQAELTKYDGDDASNMLQLELDVLNREMALAAAELDSLQKMLSRQRAADSAAALERAREAVRAAPPSLQPHAEENVKLAEDSFSLSGPIEEARRKLEQTTIRLEDVQKQLTATEQRVNDIGLTGSVGALLRRQRISLPDVRRRKRNVQDRKTQIEDAQYALFEYDDLRSETIEASVKRMTAGVTTADKDERDRLEKLALAVVEKRREYLDGVIRNYNVYLDTLFELDATEQRLIRVTERYQDYIDERVLWIRSNRPLYSTFSIDPSDTWAFEAERWSELSQLLADDLESNLFVYILAAAIGGILLYKKPGYRRELEELGTVAQRGTCTAYSPTLRAGFVTLMLAILWPGVVYFVSWRCFVASTNSVFVRAVAQTLIAVAFVYLPLELLRRVCARRGLADAHFDWPSAAIRVLRSNLRWATLLGLLVVFITSLLYFTDPEHGVDAVERSTFIVGMLILAVFMRRVLRPDTGIFRQYLLSHVGGWIDRLKIVWYWGCVFLPLLLAGMTILGFYYTAQQLAWRLYSSIMFIFIMQLLRAFLQRLLLLQRRSISIQLAKERQAAARAQSAETPHTTPEQIVPVGELRPDVHANTQQSQRLVRTGLIVFTLIGTWMIWVDVLPALRFLDQWPLWTTTVDAAAPLTAGSGPVPGAPAAPATETTPAVPVGTVDSLHVVTVADVGLAILIGIVTIACARNIPGLMEITLLQRLPLDNSIRYAVTTITSYAIVLLGVILGFNAIEVGWSKVQWLATALTFGLAFGLQEIFANFVAGLILLFERPIRVGDVVTVDEVSGVVSRIRIRATTITNWDRKEYVIPNKEFITGRMLNWTLSDKLNRIVINVGVAYGSDVDRAKQLLMQTCTEHPLILKEPPTMVTFEGFGDNSLNLVVRTFLPDLDNRLVVIDQLHSSIDRAFREAGVEISFPQRDLHVRSVDKEVWEHLRGDTDSKAT